MGKRKEKSKNIDEDSIPRSKYLSISSIKNSADSFIISLSEGLFKDAIIEREGFILPDERHEILMNEAKKNLIIPAKDQIDDDLINQGTIDASAEERKHKK